MNKNSPAYQTALAIYEAANDNRGMRHAGHKPETYARHIDALLDRVARHVGSLQIMSGQACCYANAVREYKSEFGEDSRSELEAARQRGGPIKVRRIWVDDHGYEIPDTDRRLYHKKCERCDHFYSVGVGRHEGQFLCLGCIDDERNDDEIYGRSE